MKKIFIVSLLIIASFLATSTHATMINLGSDDSGIWTIDYSPILNTCIANMSYTGPIIDAKNYFATTPLIYNGESFYGKLPSKLGPGISVLSRIYYEEWANNPTTPLLNNTTLDILESYWINDGDSTTSMVFAMLAGAHANISSMTTNIIGIWTYPGDIRGLGSSSAPAPVPEPASAMLLLTGLGTIGLIRFRKRNKSV